MKAFGGLFWCFFNPLYFFHAVNLENNRFFVLSGDRQIKQTVSRWRRKNMLKMLQKKKNSCARARSGGF